MMALEQLQHEARHHQLRNVSATLVSTIRKINQGPVRGAFGGPVGAPPGGPAAPRGTPAGPPLGARSRGAVGGLAFPPVV